MANRVKQQSEFENRRGTKTGNYWLREDELINAVQGSLPNSRVRRFGNDLRIKHIDFEPSHDLYFAAVKDNVSLGEFHIDIPFGYEPVIILESDEIEWQHDDEAQP